MVLPLPFSPFVGHSMAFTGHYDRRLRPDDLSGFPLDVWPHAMSCLCRP